MKTRRPWAGLCLILVLFLPSRAFALANRVFLSASTGNDLNGCDNIGTPCKTFAGAIAQLNPDGEAIVLTSGGYGAVTITQGVTIEASAGVTAFIHPPGSGNAVTVNAPGAIVTLRGLVLNSGPLSGIEVTSVGVLYVERCTITGFMVGVHMGGSGHLSLVDTAVKQNTQMGVTADTSFGTANVTIDGCSLDDNAYAGFYASPSASGVVRATATRTTANHNTVYGWYAAFAYTLNLDFCSASQNGNAGVIATGPAGSVLRVSNTVVTSNGQYGVIRTQPGPLLSRVNNTIEGNGTDMSGSPGTFSAH